MPKIPEGATVPQDRKPKAKADKVDPSKPFRFEVDGETYEIDGVLEQLTPGFLRKHRNSDEIDATYTLLELTCDAETLEVLDTMDLRENAKLMARFNDYVESVIGAAMGESGRSSS